MKYKFLAAASAIAIISTMGFTGALSVKASPATAYWEGTYASGAIVKGEDCPVIVKRETLNLKISSLPREGKIELDSYTAEATAEYTFYNPTDSAVDMTLLLPFGVFPSYMAEDYTDEISSVSVDGVDVECDVRYTFASYVFDADRDMERVNDEKKTDAFYREDMSVREYRIQLPASDKTESDYLKIKLSFNPKKTRALFAAEGTRLCVMSGDMYAYVPLSGTQGASAVFYAVGDELTVDLNPDQKDALSAVNLSSVSQMTFSEFALSGWSEETGVTETDWYNAFVDMLNEKSGIYGSLDSFSLEAKNLMRWYEYEMHIPAGGEALYQVKAPLFPTVEGETNPRYEYSYLLSPAAKWADLYDIEIRIDTPYYLSNGSLDFDKEEREDGEGFTYTFFRQSLPQGELTFVLTENDAAESDFAIFDDSFLRPSLTWAYITLSVLAGVAAIVTVVVVLSLRKKKR